MKLEMVVFGGLSKYTEQELFGLFVNRACPPIRLLPAHVQAVLVACLLLFPQILQYAWYTKVQSVAFPRRPELHLRSVVSLHPTNHARWQARARAGCTVVQDEQPGITRPSVPMAPALDFHRAGCASFVHSGRRTRHPRVAVPGHRPKRLPISPPGKASASSCGGPPSPLRVWAPTAGG